MLEFRWIAAIALWTIMIGPVMDFGASRMAIKARVSPMAQSR